MPEHTPGTKAKRSVPAMGRHSRQTGAGRGAGLHNSRASGREKRRHCLVCREGTGPAWDSRGQQPHPCTAPHMACVPLGQRGRRAHHVPEYPRTLHRLSETPSSHTGRSVSLRDGPPRPPPLPGALRRGRAQRHHWVAPERRGRQGRVVHSPSLPVSLPEPGGASGYQPGGSVLNHAHPGVPHSSGCIWRDEMAAGSYGLLLLSKAVLLQPSLR